MCDARGVAQGHPQATVFEDRKPGLIYPRLQKNRWCRKLAASEGGLPGSGTGTRPDGLGDSGAQEWRAARRRYSSGSRRPLPRRTRSGRAPARRPWTRRAAGGCARPAWSPPGRAANPPSPAPPRARSRCPGRGCRPPASDASSPPAPGRRSVAWAVPTTCPSSTRRSIQFSHPWVPSGDRPASWRAYRASSGASELGAPPVQVCSRTSSKTPTASRACTRRSGSRHRRGVVSGAAAGQGVGTVMGGHPRRAAQTGGGGAGHTG